MSGLGRGLALRLWSRLHLSIKVSDCGVLQQTDRALGRLLAGTKACQETRSSRALSCMLSRCSGP